MNKGRLIKGDLPEEILADFNSRRELSLDCEMMGLKPRRDRLCVVQIAAEDGPCAIMQIDEKESYPRLRSVLENPEVQKIFHFARMDTLFLLVRLKIDVKNVFCTKIASKIARTYTDRHGLKELVREIAGETMDKSNQTSDWGKETLSDDQVFYAEQDVRYLFAIKRKLVEMLEREHRMLLAQETFAYLPTRVKLDGLGYEDILDH